MRMKRMSEPKVKIDLAEAAEWLNVDPGDLANYALALYFLDLHKQGTLALTLEEKAEFEAIAKELEPKIEPAVEKAKGKKLEQVTATFFLPKRLIRLIQGENYFGWTRQEFYTNSVKGLISCVTSEMDSETKENLKTKYGVDVARDTVVELPDC